jgi:hypothetical protein
MNEGLQTCGHFSGREEIRNGAVIISRLALTLNTPPPAKPVAI